MILQLAFVLTAIIIGARLGGIGLGVMGGVGLGILTFVFGLQPTAPPIDVMLMIAAVISAASCMQAAGGLDYMVKLAEHLLRKNPSHVTLLSPLVTYLFTFIAGTGHVAYSVLPVIAEVATETKIRPERPLGIAVIASQQAITASPISAATVALLGLLAGFDITLFDILKITIPATIKSISSGKYSSSGSTLKNIDIITSHGSGENTCITFPVGIDRCYRLVPLRRQVPALDLYRRHTTLQLRPPLRHAGVEIILPANHGLLVAEEFLCGQLFIFRQRDEAEVHVRRCFMQRDGRCRQRSR